MDKLTSLLRWKLTIKPPETKADSEPQRGETITLKLPPEILSTIFSYLGRNSRDLQRVTGVCSRWRTVSVQFPYLWTSIIVDTRGLDKKRTKLHIACVDLFLSRTGHLPLDVEWHAPTSSDSIPKFYTLFREKGTFDRWRTLTLDIGSHTNHSFGPLREVDKFSNLKDLKLWATPPRVYLEHISQTATKVRMLELASSLSCPPNFHTVYRRILERITTLNIWSGIILPVAPLPPNVTTLHVYTMPDLPITHVRHLFITTIGQESFSAQRLSGLVTLLIHQTINDCQADVPIILPNLIWLGFRGNAFTAVGAFVVPSLYTLSIRCRGHETQTVDGPLIKALWSGFEAPKLLMLFLDMTLDGPATLAVLRLFSGISRVDLYCPDAEHGRGILSHVFPRQRDPTLCPMLDVLRVVLDVPPPDVISWKLLVRDTVCRIGEPFWILETRWPEGRFAKAIGFGKSQKNPCVHPWLQ